MIPSTTTALRSDSGITPMAKPKATAISRIDRTLPDRTGWMMLLGITETMWS